MKQQENRAESQEKQIRFIDSHYNLKFYIPDGGKIRITCRRQLVRAVLRYR